MDPAAIINSGANTTSYHHLSEIWQFPPADSTNGLGLRLPQFGLGFGDFAREDPNSNPVGSEKQRQSAAAVKLGRKRRDSEEESVKCVSTSNGGGSGSGNGVNDGCNGKRAKKSGNKNGETIAEHSSGKNVEPTSEPPKQDYIHVRARRGQATDSHSLAERLQGPYLYLAENFMDQSSARREKISERMKILQDLVPGCNKVIGKALVLDEIINYIQSLQRQVEFLSMKLETVNTRLTPGIEVFPPKDFDQQTFDTTVMPFASQATREYSRGSSPEWLHMQVGGGFERPT